MIFRKAGLNILLSGIFIFFIFQTVFSQTVISLQYGLGNYSVKDEYISKEKYSGTLPLF